MKINFLKFVSSLDVHNGAKLEEATAKNHADKMARNWLGMELI